MYYMQVPSYVRPQFKIIERFYLQSPLEHAENGDTKGNVPENSKEEQNGILKLKTEPKLFNFLVDIFFH